VAAVSVVNKGARDSAASEFFGAFDRSYEGMTVVGIAGQRLAVQHELAGARALVVTIEILISNL
jgi:hypothetical protein